MVQICGTLLLKNAEDCFSASGFGKPLSRGEGLNSARVGTERLEPIVHCFVSRAHNSEHFCNVSNIMASNEQVVEQKENIPEVLASKHPLENTWTFWYYRNDKSKVWDENLLKLTSFSSVEDFWSLYNHVKLVSTLPQGCDYCIFKDNIKPMWEEPRNVHGGRWVLTLSKHGRTQELDNLWLELLLCLVGEGFDDEQGGICGAVVNVRPKGDKISLWTSNANDERQCMELGRVMKRRLNLGTGIIMSYLPHVDNVNRRGSVIKSKYNI